MRTTLADATVAGLEQADVLDRLADELFQLQARAYSA